MAIIDVITYNGERDLFDLRYNILKDYVDQFIVVEFNKTFSGKDKPYYFEEIKDQYEKVRFCPMDETKYEKYYAEACQSPNTEYGKGANHWIREFCQKESIRDCLTHLKDDDIVYIGDCDEIWEPEGLGAQGKLKLRVYTYYLNNRSSEVFYGAITYPYKLIKDECLNHVRSDSPKDDHYAGWHFTSLKDDLRQKLLDSYTDETYATDVVLDNLEQNVEKNLDFLGRHFTFKVDESDWPQYLKQNRHKYLHLLK